MGGNLGPDTLEELGDGLLSVAPLVVAVRQCFFPFRLHLFGRHFPGWRLGVQ